MGDRGLQAGVVGLVNQFTPVQNQKAICCRLIKHVADSRLTMVPMKLNVLDIPDIPRPQRPRRRTSPNHGAWNDLAHMLERPAVKGRVAPVR